MQKESNLNLIIFGVCSILILGLYQFFWIAPQTKQHQAALAAAQAAAQRQQTVLQGAKGLAISGGATSDAPHVIIDTPSLTGALSLQGARIDQLALKHYRVPVTPNAPVTASSPMVQLLRPAGQDHAWFMQTGWISPSVGALPEDDGVTWTAPAGARLTPQTPLVLTYDGQGLAVTRTIAVDDNAMFTVTDAIVNHTAQPLALRQYGLVEQRGQGLPDGLAHSGIVHEGAIAMTTDAKPLQLAAYQAWKKKGLPDVPSVGGWVGVTEKYWLTALIPDQRLKLTDTFPVDVAGAQETYKSGFLGQTETIAPGATLTRTTRLFAGAKVVPVLKAYSTQLGIPKLDQAVDWGNFWFFTRPLFGLLEALKHTIGNLGLSILALTVIVKLVFFPLANKSYESMSKMKKIQPQIEAIKKQFPEDQAKVQQETMALYQREKINPFMGCLPMLIQIPVFFSLYKVLTVTIEMRQAPFFGWIHDLSSRDPTTIWNLFGLIPWDPSHLMLVGAVFDNQLHLGAWPLIYGFTMWLSQAMSPPAGTDPSQRLMFQMMPIVFTFIMTQFPAGLLIYWTWNNLLTITQQYVIMHRLKVDNPIDTLLARFSGARPAG